MQGDIIGVYDSAGKLIYSYAYDAWGNFTQTKGPDSTAFERYVADHNPFRYRGYIYDGALQAYYAAKQIVKYTFVRNCIKKAVAVNAGRFVLGTIANNVGGKHFNSVGENHLNNRERWDIQ